MTTAELFDALPVYPDGIASPALLNAGQGLYDGRCIENPESTGLFKEGETIDDDTFRDRMMQMGGDCNLQYNEDGCVALRYYYNQRMLTALIRDGHVHVFFNDEFVREPEKPELMKVIKETSLIAFENYMKQLSGSGLKLLYRNKIENNLFYEFDDNGVLLNCSLNGNTRTARLIMDNCSTCSVKDIGYEVSGEPCELYQFANNHQRMVFGYSCDCGMCYLMKLADNSILLIDGPEYEQSTRRNTERLMDLMHEITHTRSGEPVRVAAWFCTHAHDDHMDMFSHLIALHHDEIRLERVLFNFADTHQISMLPQACLMMNRVRRLYPDVRYRKLHMGDSFTLASTKLEVMSTHEQGIGLNGYEHPTNTNDTSTILKLSFDGISFLILGDVDTLGESILLQNLGEPTLHSDIVQCSHHLINRLEHLYDVVHADYCLIPQSDKCRRPGVVDEEYNQITRTVPYDNFFFAGVSTDGFRAKDGRVDHFYSTPLVRELYDGSMT